MKECPVCHELKTNAGLKAHMTRMHPDCESLDSLDVLMRSLQKDWGEIKIVSENPRQEMSLNPKPVYKETTSQRAENVLKFQERMSQLTNPEPPKRRLARKLKVTTIKPKKTRFAFLAHWHTRPIRESKKNKDPEDALELVTAIPAVVIVLFLLYKAFVAIYTWNFNFFVGWTKSDIAQLYFWVLQNPTQLASILILVMTGLLVALTIFLVHRLIWRICFKDLQVRYLKKDETTGELRAVGTSRIGRMYLAIGSGFWDRFYRRLTKKPVPNVVTIYFKRRGFVNPFKVLASCEKGYLKDPDRSMFVIDGLFKRTLIATHLRRDTENNSTVYWFEGGDYEAIEFDSKWYEDTHQDEIKTGLRMVGKACGMDSSIQKDQMRSSISYSPPDLIAEQKRIWELKKAKMQKSQPELSR